MTDIVEGPALAALSCGKPAFLVVLLHGEGADVQSMVDRCAQLGADNAQGRISRRRRARRRRWRAALVRCGGPRGARQRARGARPVPRRGAGQTPAAALASGAGRLLAGRDSGAARRPRAARARGRDRRLFGRPLWRVAAHRRGWRAARPADPWRRRRGRAAHRDARDQGRFDRAGRPRLVDDAQGSRPCDGR